MKSSRLSLLFIMMFCLALPMVSATISDAFLGSAASRNLDNIVSIVTEDDILNLQELNAEKLAQIENEQMITELKRESLTEQLLDSFLLIAGLFFLITDIFTLLFYYLEMHLMLYFLIEVFPGIFCKIRDSISMFVISRWLK